MRAWVPMTKTKKTGTKKMASRVPLIMPPNTPVPMACWVSALAPRCNLHVLLLDGLRHLADGQPVGGELARIHPDAHGLLGAEQLHSPHAVDAAQLLHDIAGHVVVQRDLIEAAIR